MRREMAQRSSNWRVLNEYVPPFLPFPFYRGMGMGRLAGRMTRTYTTRDWLDSIFNLKELLSLTENELAVLEEIDGDLTLKAEWWRRRRRREA